MIEETILRFQCTDLKTISFSGGAVVGSKRHAALLMDSLPKARKIFEPFGRDSAPAVAAACLAFRPEDLIIILPADHDIVDVKAFHNAIEIAAEAAEHGAIVTFGIEPTYPATGYGYIKAAAADKNAAKAVEAFVEKPAEAKAKSYLAAGSYFWNAGIFLFKAGTMLDALSRLAPDVLEGVTRSMSGTTEEQIIHLKPEEFSKTPSISIDYAVMENASNVKTVPVSMGWSDVGGYRPLHELLTDESKENLAYGPVHIQNSEGLYARSEGPSVTINGVSDLIVVATPNEVMITPIDDDGAAKELGSIVRNNRVSLSLDPDFMKSSTHWLWSLFDYWHSRVWDDVHDGFVEQVSFSGEPDFESPRRVRVQARQVFSFARALQYGWANVDEARRIIGKGLTYIDEKLRHSEGGWVHIVDRHGTAIDRKRDLYDHAFLILAGAAAYEATGDEKALVIANDARRFINSNLKDAASGGWFEDDQRSLPRRANPHMHLLEASCALFEATGDESDLDIARQSVLLFEKHFFEPGGDILGEFFKEDWRSVEYSMSETTFEVGHMYEWATLLHEFEMLTGHDTLSWRRRLVRRADERVKKSGSGFALNAERLDGQKVNSRRRLWPQLEMFRAHMLHPGLAQNGTPERIFRSMKSEYIDTAPLGLWIDEFDEVGKRHSNAVPASILYHFVTAILPMLR